MQGVWATGNAAFGKHDGGILLFVWRQFHAFKFDVLLVLMYSSFMYFFVLLEAMKILW